MTELFLPARGSHVLVRLLKGSSQGQQDPDQKNPYLKNFSIWKLSLRSLGLIPLVGQRSWSPSCSSLPKKPRHLPPPWVVPCRREQRARYLVWRVGGEELTSPGFKCPLHLRLWSSSPRIAANSIHGSGSLPGRGGSEQVQGKSCYWLRQFLFSWDALCTVITLPLPLQVKDLEQNPREPHLPRAGWMQRRGSLLSKSWQPLWVSRLRSLWLAHREVTFILHLHWPASRYSGENLLCLYLKKTCLYTRTMFSDHAYID